MIPQSTKVWHPELSNIHNGAKIGERCTIHSHVWIGDSVTIGDDCKIEAFVFIPPGVIIGNNVFIGPHVTFTNDMHPPSGGKGWLETHIEEGVGIGAGAVILPGLTISKKAFIGAGAVVVKDVPAGVTVVGNPARPIDRPLRT